MKDYFFLALKNIKRRKLRSWLTIIGILIGIAAIVALISISQGMEDTINEQFEKMGTNKIIIMPGGEIEGIPGMMSGMMAEYLTEDDVETIEKAKGVEIVSPIIAKVSKVEYSKEKAYTFIYAWSMDKRKEIWEDMMEIAQGRDLEEKDKHCVVVGDDINDLFDKEVKIGSKLEIENESFRVVGILKPTGGRDNDLAVYMELKIAQELFDTNEFMTIYVQIKDGFEPTQVGENIKKELRKAKDEKEGEESFSIQTSEQMLEAFGIVLNVIRVVLIGIASISLFVGGVGTMNTMYTSVLERTKEIGTMKAVGAKNSDILLIFLFESGLYGLIGGAVGIVLGLGISKGAELLASPYLGAGIFKVSMAWWLILGALLFSFVVGTISGVLPAMQAARLKPAEALRHE
ncbi:ABC transporter permease [Candidatus Pacearchaeota archaeon]|nr:ABC transporter permease [Candidatus Pacearchaeota archaeon]